MGRHRKITLNDTLMMLHEAGGPVPIGCGRDRVPPRMARALALLGEADIVRTWWRGIVPTRRKLVILTPSGSFVARMMRQSGLGNL